VGIGMKFDPISMILDPIQCNSIDPNDVGSNPIILGSDSKLYIYNEK